MGSFHSCSQSAEVPLAPLSRSIQGLVGRDFLCHFSAPNPPSYGEAIGEAGLLRTRGLCRDHGARIRLLDGFRSTPWLQPCWDMASNLLFRRSSKPSAIPRHPGSCFALWASLGIHSALRNPTTLSVEQPMVNVLVEPDYWLSP